MKSHVLALAALAAIGFSGAAFAGEATQPGRATGPVTMSDSELDSTYAGVVANRTIQVTTAGAPESGQFHQTNQSGTGHDHPKLNCVSNQGTVNC
jgi:hypothetical protein